MIEISTERSRLDLERIHRHLSTEAYWAMDRPLAATLAAWGSSLGFGAFDGDELVGWGRGFSDGALFAYVGDVFVLEHRRGRGVGRALLTAMLGHPTLRDVPRVLLATNDAHGLYASFGFTPLEQPATWMQRTLGA